jgi:sirohydrochlorin ferrochelatase
VIAAHGTRCETGMATTHAIATAVAAARPDTSVELCFLDVASPSLKDVLDRLDGPAVVVPLLLSAGYHVTTDIPNVVAGRPEVRVTDHLGPDPMVISAVAGRLRQAAPSLDEYATVALAAIGSSRPAARAEVDEAADRLSESLSRSVTVLPLDAELPDAVAQLPSPIAVAPYLVAEGGFLDNLRGAVGPRGVVAAPIGDHPALVALVWTRYDDACQGPSDFEDA